jgi:hypothetical protein
MPLNAFTRHRPLCKAYHERNFYPWLTMAPAYRRGTDECEVPPLDIGIQAIQLSPYRAGVAGPCHTRLLTSPAFPSCSCSLSFQNQVRRVASESSALNSDPLRGQFTPCVPWRTVSSSSGFPSLQTLMITTCQRVNTRCRGRATLGLDNRGHTS